MADIDDVMDKLEDVIDKINDVKTNLDTVKDVERLCRHCYGTGNKASPDGPGSCVNCGGTGRTKTGEIKPAG